jgi:uncharacterized membrane protein
MTSATHTYEPGSAEARRREGNGRRSNGGRPDEGERLARALGVFSIGLGLAQILAPHRVARAIGVDDDDENGKTMRAVGFREIATGVGLLTRPRPAAFAWGRVTGDAMDLAMLGRAFNSRRNNHNRLAAATAAVAGVTILDIIASQRLSRAGNGTSVRTSAHHQGIRVSKAITINCPPEEVYGYWRNLENRPRFMAHVKSVRVLDDRRSYWKIRTPLGTTVEWTAEIIEDRPNELISWRSTEDAQVPNSGTVRFTRAPGGRGTELHLEVEFDPPAGAVGVTIAKLMGRNPSRQVDDDLRRFKQIMETGEVVHSDASIHPALHPARPPEVAPNPHNGSASRELEPQNGGFE